MLNGPATNTRRYMKRQKMNQERQMYEILSAVKDHKSLAAILYRDIATPSN